MDEKALSLFSDFLLERLQGDLDVLELFDFRTLKGDDKYGGVYGPDMVENFAITKAISALLYHEGWPNLTMNSLDKGLYQIGTIIHYQRLLGVRMAERYFKGLRCYKPSEKIIDMAEEIHRLDGIIGNFIVWPHRGSKFIHSFHAGVKMQGYIDKLFIAIYQVMIKNYDWNEEIAELIYLNRDLWSKYTGHGGFKRFMEDNLLNDFISKEGYPFDLFNLTNVVSGKLDETHYFQEIEYFYMIIKHLIEQRTRRIIDKLRFTLGFE